MRHWLKLLAAAAWFAVALPQAYAEEPAQDDQYDGQDYYDDDVSVLDAAGSKRILNVIRDIDAVLSDDAVTHFATLAEFSDQYYYLTGSPALDGLVVLDLDRRPDVPHAAVLSLYFADDALRDRFHAALINVFGEPDPACYSEQESNWSPTPGRSVSWRALDFGLAMVDLTIRDDDPLDANCSRTSSGPEQLLSEAEMSGFLQRLLDEPLPFGDLKKFQAWLKPYGGMDIHSGDGCYSSVIMPPAESNGATIDGLDGVSFLMANLHGCEDVDYGLSYLSLASYADMDMFAADKFITAADAILGERIAACSDDYQNAWRIDDDSTLILSDSYLSFVAMIYRAEPSLLGCS